MDCLNSAWQAHAPELRHWMRHRLRNPAQADDLRQGVFLKALGQGERFCSVHNLHAWLFEVARNLLADRLRVTRKTFELPEDLPAPAQDTDTVDQLTACLPRVLSELSAGDRDAITRCDLQGMSQAEFAMLSGLGLRAARSRLQRARQRLKTRMTQVLPGAAGRRRPCDGLCAAPVCSVFNSFQRKPGGRKSHFLLIKRYYQAACQHSSFFSVIANLRSPAPDSACPGLDPGFQSNPDKV